MTEDNMIKTLLQGKPLEHPIHPMLVHFPIGLFALSLTLDIASLIVGDALLVETALYAMVAGIVMALLAALPGLVDYSDIRADHPAKKIATRHLFLNVTAVVLFSVSALLRITGPETDSTALLPLVLSLIGIGILGYSGYLGGEMVYNDGIAVGRHRRHTDTPEETITVSPDGATADGYATVASLDELEEGSTLRAEVNGHVMTVTRVNGDVYAFQEFCPHRFGPLSEGHLHGYDIMCPWHRSCFDVRTGKVTQGPAKVDLNVHDVSIVDDQIRVRIPPE